MARRYTRSKNGKFAHKSDGEKVETIQQNKARKDEEKQKAKKNLSGGKVGAKKRRRPGVRNKAVGKRATTKAAKNALARSKKNFG